MPPATPTGTTTKDPPETESRAGGGHAAGGADAGDLDIKDQPNSTELARWWEQPLAPHDLRTAHFEFAFVPAGVGGVKRGERAADPRYTRAWRRASLLRLLRAWHELSLRLNVSYWLDAGALLGRMRSGGEDIIPWDVDADVGMLRGEFAKLNRSTNQGVLRDQELGLPPDVLVTTQQVPSAANRATARARETPGRIIDTLTGLYVDIFGDFFLREDGDVQMFWPYPGVAKCTGDAADAAYHAAAGVQMCQGPCDQEWCYIFSREAVLPPAHCRLKGAGGLFCPRDEAAYLRAQYFDCCSPAYRWSSKLQDFVYPPY